MRYMPITLVRTRVRVLAGRASHVRPATRHTHIVSGRVTRHALFERRALLTDLGRRMRDQPVGMWRNL